MDGERVNLWEYEKKHLAKTVRYSFYVRDDGSPVKLHQHGNDIFTGSHVDEWMVRLWHCLRGFRRIRLFGTSVNRR